MRRLAGSDAGFLFIESPDQTSVCVDLAILVPTGEPVTLEALRARVAERIDLLPAWRWRLETVPLGVHHPIWIDDPDFDLDNHLHQTTIPEPGGPDEVDAFMAEVEPRLLDLRHPLWEITLVHGLHGGRQALLFRFHHSLADGSALLLTLDLLLDPSPDPPTSSPADRPAGVPARRTILAAALREQGRNWRAAPGLVSTTRARFAAVEQRRSEPVPLVPRSMGDAPGTRFNRPGPRRRTYARTRLPLAQLQAVRAATEATLNDVVLAVVAGALRAYLADRGELPAAPLVANVPVAGAPTDESQQPWGNRFSNFFTSLATDVEDPVERLAAIAAGTAEAKVQLDLQGRDTLPAWLDRLPPAIARPAARAMIRRASAHPEKANFNVLVSNVRVVDPHWELAGRPVEEIFMSGPIAADAGLNVTVVGFGDHLRVAIVASPAAVENGTELTDLMDAALGELVACTV